MALAGMGDVCHEEFICAGQKMKEAETSGL